jgi:CubicO group peptidase (beta-lactamase class C family)
MFLKHAMGTLLAATLCVSVPASGQSAPAAFEPRVDAFVEEQMQLQKVPGAAIAVLHKGEIIIAKGYGRATVEHDVPVTPDTIFQSGSVGKMFTSAAIMTLVEQGQIGLDDPLAKYLPDEPAAWRPITIRQLLTHTSGIPDFEANFDLRRDYTNDELVRHAFTLALDFEPGARFSYSNTGYMLLGIIAEKASGKPYLQIIDAKIFKPLGMETARGISDADIVPHRASGYHIVAGELKNQDWVSPTMNSTADGSLYLSLKDMIGWSRGIDKNAVLSAAGWKQVHTPATLNSGKSYPYGFAWAIGEAGGKPRYHHGGAWQGFRTYYSRYLRDDLAIILLTNSAETDFDILVDGIAKLWDPALVAKPARPRPAPDAGTEQRVTKLIAAARVGHLAKDDIPIGRSGFVDGANEYFPKLLKGLSPLNKLELIDRVERGDDQIYTYNAHFGNRVLKVEFGQAPDGRGSMFMISE